MITKNILYNGEVVGAYESTGDNQQDAEIVLAILDEKGLRKEVSVNDSMYGQANSFAKVANYLYNEGLKSSPFKIESLAPFVVNATFSIELYLKTIHNAYGNNIRGHHLSSIYKGMPKSGKNHFNKSAIDVREHYQLGLGVNIQSCLDNLSESFEHWRYLYENRKLSVEIQSTRYLMHVSHEACVRSRSEVNAKQEGH